MSDPDATVPPPLRHLCLVDGSGYIFRAFFAIKTPMTRPDGTPVGTARLAHDADEARVAVVSQHLAPEARGRGVGRVLLEALADEARAHGFTQLRAFVKATNDASARAFVATGYARVAEATIEGAPALHFERAL